MGISDAVQQQYVVEDSLGRGSYGEVLRVRLGTDMVAMKRPTPRQEGECAAAFGRRRRGMLTEAVKHGRLHHPAILRFLGWARDGAGSLLLFSELCSGGTLLALLRRQLAPSRRAPLAVGAVSAIARALAHMHSHQWAHLDLAARNVLLDRETEPDSVRQPQLGFDWSRTTPPRCLAPAASATSDTGCIIERKLHLLPALAALPVKAELSVLLVLAVLPGLRETAAPASLVGLATLVELKALAALAAPVARAARAAPAALEALPTLPDT
eukprot:gene57672-biopygen17137